MRVSPSMHICTLEGDEPVEEAEGAREPEILDIDMEILDMEIHVATKSIHSYMKHKKLEKI